MTERVVYLGLGTNLGDRMENLRSAIRMLHDGAGLRLLRCSRVYETEPWGGIEQPSFLNCVVEAATTLDPEALLMLCKDVEERLGRVPGVRWGPRLIDVDILLYGSEVIDMPHLEISASTPAPAGFALVPLAELCPQRVHPVLNRSIAELRGDADGLEGVRPAGDTGLAVGAPEC